jgi:hypothetical protein
MTRPIRKWASRLAPNENPAGINGGAPAPQGLKSRRNSDMLGVLEARGNVADASAITRAPKGRTAELEGIIQPGRMLIGPDLAKRILFERNYERQRAIEQFHVDLWAETIRRGEFGPGRQIWFCVLAGRLHLVDGQHRLSAVVATLRQIEFQVEFLEVADADALNAAYISFDRIGRSRSLPEVLNAMGVADIHSLSKGMATSIFRAALLLEFNFDPPHHTVDPIAVRGDNARLEYAKPYWAFGAKYEGLIKGAPVHVRARLRTPSIVAVAVATLIHQPEQAALFWKTLADNDGLRKLDPRHTMLDAIMARDFGSARMMAAKIAANAWNAFYEHRTIKTIKPGQTNSIRIAGTPYTGKVR